MLVHQNMGVLLGPDRRLLEPPIPQGQACLEQLGGDTDKVHQAEEHQVAALLDTFLVETTSHPVAQRLGQPGLVLRVLFYPLAQEAVAEAVGDADHSAKLEVLVLSPVAGEAEAATL